METKFLIVYNEKQYNTIKGTIIRTGTVTTMLDIMITIKDKSKICYCALESICFFPELNYSLQ